MSRERKTSRQSIRHRVYAMVTLGMVCLVGLVSLSAMLARGHDELSRRVYRFPHKTLVHLAKAQNRFFRKDLDEDGQHDYAASLAELEQAGVITNTLARGELEGYRYRIRSATASEWCGEASPVAVTSQTLFYYVDQSYVVRSSPSGPAGPESEVFWSPRMSGWGR